MKNVNRMVSGARLFVVTKGNGRGRAESHRGSHISPIINVKFYSHVLMIIGFQQEQPLAAMFSITTEAPQCCTHEANWPS